MSEIIHPIEFFKTVEFNVPGQPKGKERPRTVRIRGRITTYTPKNTVDYENKIRNSFNKANKDNIMFERNTPIEADILAVFEVPKSVSKKNREKMLSGKIKYTKKPDCDNITKVVLDALNKVAYYDDSQVCNVNIKRIYGNDPGVTIKLTEL